jgi:hypothetical protein
LLFHSTKQAKRLGVLEEGYAKIDILDLRWVLIVLSKKIIAVVGKPQHIGKRNRPILLGKP